MVKKEKTKTNPKEWVEGDAFGYRIENSRYPEFNGRYLILIYTEVPEWELSKSVYTFRAKVTEGKKLPQTIEEIKNMEYIIVHWTSVVYEMAYYDDNVKIPPEDEYGFIYTYTFQFNISKKANLSLFTYLGNVGKEKLDNEYIAPDSVNAGLYAIFKTFQDHLVHAYKQYNLKEWQGYTEEGKIKEWLESMGIYPDEEERKDSLTYVGGGDEKF